MDLKEYLDKVDRRIAEMGREELADFVREKARRAEDREAFLESLMPGKEKSKVLSEGVLAEADALLLKLEGGSLYMLAEDDVDEDDWCDDTCEIRYVNYAEVSVMPKLLSNNLY